MKFAIAAALALFAAPSLSTQVTQTAAQSPPAQAPQSAPDLSIAKPVDGTWTYAATSDGSEATFTNSGGIPQLWVHCTRATRKVSIVKAATSAAPFIDVWTSSQTRHVPASFKPATGRLTIDLDANDSLLDALSNSRGRVGFTVSPQPSLVVPAWPEPDRVIEDCRA